MVSDFHSKIYPKDFRNKIISITSFSSPTENLLSPSLIFPLPNEPPGAMRKSSHASPRPFLTVFCLELFFARAPAKSSWRCCRRCCGSRSGLVVVGTEQNRTRSLPARPGSGQSTVDARGKRFGFFVRSSWREFSRKVLVGFESLVNRWAPRVWRSLRESSIFLGRWVCEKVWNAITWFSSRVIDQSVEVVTKVGLELLIL